jgi:hypothetical protein
MASPRICLIEPNVGDGGVPDFGPSEWVYERYVLLRSLVALEARNGAVCLPSDLEELVEQVYGNHPLDIPPLYAAELVKSEKEMREEHRRMNRSAKGVMMWGPSTDDLFEQPNLRLEEDDPDAHRRVQAATRDTEPTVQLVLVYHRDGKDYLDPAGLEPLSELEVPDVTRVRRLLDNEVTISHKGCVFHYVGQPVPTGWRKCGMLRYHRLLRVNAAGASQTDSLIGVDHHLGVVIRRNDPAGGV